MSTFHEVLAIAPGRELDAFPVRLRQVMTLEAFANTDMADAFVALDAFYAEHHDIAPAGDFERIACLLAPPAPEGDGYADLRPGAERIGNLTLFTPPADPVDHGLRTMTSYYGACDEGLSLAQAAWQERAEVKALLRMLHMATRRQGCVTVPATWTAGTLDMHVAGPLWWIRLVEGLALYDGIECPDVDALHDLARWLFAAGTDTADHAAFYLWDEVLVQHATGNPAGTIDGMALAAWLPQGHPRFDRLVGELLASPNAAVRWHAALQLVQRPSVGCLAALATAAQRETAWAAAVDQVRALRLIGGEAAFDALLAIATEGATASARGLAARALAWVERCPHGRLRIGALLRQGNPVRRRIGAEALVEARRGTVFGRGGLLAGPEERQFLDELRRYLHAPLDNEPPAVLVRMLGTGLVSVEIEREGGDIARVRCLSMGGTPLVDDRERPRALAAMLARLGVSNLADCRLDDDAMGALLQRR